MGDCIIHEVLISFWGFTRFWSLPYPAEGHLRGLCHSGSLFTRFWSRSLCYFQHDRSEFLFIGKLCKVLLLFTYFCEFQPLLWGAAPFFLPLFRQKSTFFVETVQLDSQYLVAFLWKWITFGVRLRPLPASPIYEVLISFWGFRASGRDTNLVNQLPAPRYQRDQNLVNWIRPKADWARSKPRIYIIYIVYILSFLRSKPRKSSLPRKKCEIKTS